jgi:hypothetical protein
MLSKNFATGITLPTSSTNVLTKCIPCLIERSPQISYQNNANQATEVCKLIYIDTCGPFPKPTPRKEQYFTIFLDNAANFSHTELLVAKSDITMPESRDLLILIISIHVDDRLAISNSLSLYTWFVQEMSKKVNFVCLGPITDT